MNLSDQVCDLVLAKKLKELGVVQQACFFWVVNPLGDAALAESGFGQLPYKWWHKTNWAAFTVAELIDMLPRSVPDMKVGRLEDFWLEINKANPEHEWFVGYKNSDWDDIYDHYNKSLAEALAACLIHLIENNLIQL